MVSSIDTFQVFLDMHYILFFFAAIWKEQEKIKEK